ncbi:TetR/AcrR family transcriptional regulator [Nocardioides sp. R-C-SC26]|uniref:TetR/AcrR family transcriptional regulator n=1 Tax=Nocardioides sp. R-C-SC26 TaxID=2870414 RepID=UPI001E5747B1|nr:TetR/AcrR family transcriptional regulator [Nocardioides sp. R-C-SC26]
MPRTSTRVLPARSRERRDALLDQLTDLYLAEGFLRLGMGDLAERLSCSRSTLYLVAPSKEQIITAVVRHYFKRAAARINRHADAVEDAAGRLHAYLDAVAEELAPATDAFYSDLADFAPAAEIYQANTEMAAQRVHDLVADGVSAGALRQVDARFVGAAVAEVMTSIQSGRIEAATGLNDAAAYRALADLVVTSLLAR